jgi:tetratricopeptide (TPR) repeat protein
MSGAVTDIAGPPGASYEDSLIALQNPIAHDLLQTIKHAPDSLQLLEAHFAYGEFLDNEGDYAASVAQLKAALKIAEKIQNDAKIASIANYLAFVYWITSDYQSSIDAYHLGLQSAERIHDSSTIAKISMNLANNYNYLGQFDKAIENALYALKIKETTHDQERICYHYISMSNIFRENQNTPKWEEYLLKAYKLKDVPGCASLGDRVKIYNGLGGIARNKNQPDQALLYYDTMMKISVEAGYDQGINTALTNSAATYKESGQPQKALYLAIEAEQYFSNDSYDIIFSHNFKAELYQAMGQYGQALALTNENIHNNNIASYSTEKLKCLDLLYELNFLLGNYQAAYAWNDSLQKYKTLLRDEDVRSTVEELEAKYQNEQKEQKISLLTAKNKITNQRIRLSWLFIGLLFVSIVLVVAMLFFRHKQAQFKQGELQQQLLLSQMNPHFIFNVMGSIQGYLYKNEAVKAADYLGRFASLSRSVLEFSSQERISLYEEIEMLKNYIELEKAGKENPFEVSFIIDPEMETGIIEIPPMLLQPFVENAIKHGLKDINYPGKLRLQFIENENYIEVEILDNGKGLSESNNSRHKSKALDIFWQRKKLIRSKLKKDLIFEINNLYDHDETKHGVRVFLQIPILNND